MALFNLNQATLKNIVIVIAEIFFVSLMALGILPREASFFIFALLVFYFLFSPLEDSLWVFVVSIPLYVALPISESFDSMSIWRPLMIVLFLVLFFRQGISITFKSGKIIEKFKHYLVEYLAGLLLIIMAISLFAARDITIGIKRIIFLINIFLLHLIIRNVAYYHKGTIPKLFQAIKVALFLTLTVGYIQLITVFFVPLHTFWQFWSRKVISVFYGGMLSELLSYSNAWFSYYSYQLPTLRMFSIFPDSHSFAFFCILSVPLFLAPIILNESLSYLKRFWLYLLLSIPLLGILFSGSRGAWASALGALLLFSFLAILIRLFRFRIGEGQINPYRKNLVLMIFGCLIIFFLLLPISSGIFLVSQKMQSGQIASLEKISLFERVKSIADFTETSAKGRLEIWVRTADSILKRPILGVGAGNFPWIIHEDMEAGKQGASAHNLYLDVAAESGIFALLVLLLILYLVVHKAWDVFNGYREPYFKVWAGFLVLALVWIMIYSLFDVVLLNDKVLLFFIANLSILYAGSSSVGYSQSSDLERGKISSTMSK